MHWRLIDLALLQLCTSALSRRHMAEGCNERWKGRKFRPVQKPKAPRRPTKAQLRALNRDLNITPLKARKPKMRRRGSPARPAQEAPLPEQTAPSLRDAHDLLTIRRDDTSITKRPPGGWNFKAGMSRRGRMLAGVSGKAVEQGEAASAITRAADPAEPIPASCGTAGTSSRNQPRPMTPGAWT